MANAAAAAVTRIPAGHTEGYLEAFATLYKEAAMAIRSPDKVSDTTINIEDGFDGVKFVNACQNSSRNGASWVYLR